MTGARSKRERRVGGGVSRPVVWGFGGLLLVFVVLLISARAMIPSEGAAAGNSLVISNGWCLALGLLGLCLWRRELPRFRWTLVDSGISLVAAGHLISAAWAVMGAGADRVSINMAWEWFGLWAAWLCLRCLTLLPGATRGLIAVLALWAVAQSGLAAWQYHWWYPRMRSEYVQLRSELDAVLERSSATSLRRQGELEQALIEMGAPLEGAPRFLWEGRLLSSSDAFGTQALANTLGGLLAVGVVLWLALRWRARSDIDWRRWQRLAATVAAVCVVQGLILTRSRTAWVATLIGIAAVILVTWVRDRRLLMGLGAGALAVLLLLLAVPAGVLGIDREVWTEAPKSLEYRFEYWHGTAAVLADNPLMGVGPGNFRDAYVEYKLPWSSEEIADPHNWLLDLWVSGGLIAVVGSGLVIWGVARVLRGPTAATAVSDREAAATTGRAAAGRPHASRTRSEAVADAGAQSVPRLIRRGLLLGPLLVLGNELLWGQPVVVSATLWLGLCLAAWWLFPRLAATEIDRRWISAAGLALAVHLCGAGGAEMPVVVETSFVLLACTMTGSPVRGRASDPTLPTANHPIGSDGTNLAAVDPAPTTSVSDVRSHFRRRSTGNWLAGSAPLVLMLLGSVGLAGGILTATRPVIVREALLTIGDAQLHSGQAAAAERYYAEAAAADPLAPEPLVRLSELRFRAASSDPRNADVEFQRGVALARLAISLEPRAAWPVGRLASEYLERFRQTHDPSELAEASRLAREAVKRYPSEPRLVVQLAIVEWEVGNGQEAVDWARRALELDDMNRQAGHADRYLDEDQRREMEQIVDPDTESESDGGREVH